MSNDSLMWDVDRDGRMADFADYTPIETWPNDEPRDVIDPKTSPVPDIDPIEVRS